MIAPVTDQYACSKQNQNDDEAYNSNDQPVNFLHFVFPLWIESIHGTGKFFQHSAWLTTSFDQTVADQGLNVFLSAHQLNKRRSYFIL
jgi:hypothetical protein